MTTQEAAEALLAWALDVAGTGSALGAIDGIQGGYPAEPAGKTLALPDVVVEISQAKRAQAGTDPRFPQWNLQQRVLLQTWDAQLSVMADVGETDDDNMNAARQVRQIADTLGDAAWNDVTLGGRFDGTYIEITSDFTPGFVAYPDGSTGRDVRISLTVAKIAR